jgi:pyruvate/2-oxoglutarate dehydrogenase complex dihydrolipoamide dehydrogenase (E3) component
LGGETATGRVRQGPEFHLIEETCDQPAHVEGSNVMSGNLEPDLCVIGGGPGGLSLALGAAACGQSVVLIEKSALGGRRLTNVVPRHVLLAVSRAAAAAHRAADFGIKDTDPRTDFTYVRQHAASVLAAITPNYTQARLEAMNVKVIRAPGRFVSADSCEAGGQKIKARSFVVATGAIERRPRIPGIELVRPLDCAALCSLEQPPQRLIVIGADPEGLTLAQALRQLGCEVIVLAGGQIFSSEDEELIAPVRAAFARDGLVIEEGVRILRIEPRGEGVRIVISSAGHERPINGSHFMVAAGRTPAVEGLGLSVAGVRYDESGIETTASLTTSNRRIQAIGGVVKGARGDGVAERDAFLVLRAILGLPGTRIRRQADARIILTSPPVAMAGLSEKQARAAHGHIHVLRWPYAETERARIEHCSIGHVKLVTSQGGTILGAGIVGSEAEELINLFTLAISKGMTVGDIASILVPYPSLTGAAQSAAVTLRESRFEAPLRRLMTAAARSIEEETLKVKELGRSLTEKARGVFWRPK